MSFSIRYRTARKAHRCEECRCRSILPGHRYEIYTVFPGDDVCNPDRPMQLKRCLSCPGEHDIGVWLTARACGTFCHGVTPCARPFGHLGACSCRDRDHVEEGAA